MFSHVTPTSASTDASFAPLPRAEITGLGVSRIRDLANAAMGRSDVAAFWFGENDTPTPGFIRAAAERSLHDGETFYTQNLGLPALREAIAGYLGQLHSTPIGAERIAVTGSGVSALMLAQQMLLSPGDRAVIVTPVWPNITEQPRILGAEVVRVPLGVANGAWSLDLDRLLAALTPETRVLVLNSPNNPTGWTIDAQSQREIFAHCRRHGIWILTDDVYERLVFDGGRAPSLLPLASPEDRLISVNSFSKAWSMTGWRLGWLVAPPAFVAELPKVIEYNTSCAPGFVQAGALAALTEEGEAAVAAIHAGLSRSRGALVDGLRRFAGVEVPEARGAMYAFFRIAGFSDDMTLAQALLREVGLGVAPGSAFGPEGAGWLRWCFAARPEKLADGLDRLGRFLGDGKG